MEKIEEVKKILDELKEDELVFPKFKNYRILRLDGKTGDFLLCSQVDELNIGQEVSVFVFAIRKKLQSFFKKNNVKYWRFSTEFSKKTDRIVLFEGNSSTDNILKLAEGLPDKIRSDFRDLRSVFSLYSFVDGFLDEPFRFVVKGASLSSLFEFLRNNSLSRERFINVRSKKVENEDGIDYFVCNFDVGQFLPSDFWTDSKVEEIRAFADALNKIKEFNLKMHSNNKFVDSNNKFVDSNGFGVFGGIENDVENIEILGENPEF
ncbi:MAG: hypothetical protein QXX68_03485 [Candidatus Pacearchaeota archaeon]